MSTTVYPPKLGSELPAPDWLGNCCNLRPVIITWTTEPLIVGVLCQNPNCINHKWGVLAYDEDVVRKWNQYRYSRKDIAEHKRTGIWDQ